MKLSFLKKAILGGLIVVAIVAGSLVAIFPVSASTETMSITPSTQSVANSATSISVSIVCDTTAATRGWGAEVDFNPAQLQETNVTYGSTFYTSTYGTAFNNPFTVNNTTGAITNLAQALLGGTGGPTGTGTLVTIVFSAVSPGGNNSVDSITLNSADSGLADASGNPLNPTINNATIVVGTPVTTTTTTTTPTTTTTTTTPTTTTTTTTPTTTTTTTTPTTTTTTTTPTTTTITTTPTTTTTTTTPPTSTTTSVAPTTTTTTTPTTTATTTTPTTTATTTTPTTITTPASTGSTAKTAKITVTNTVTVGSGSSPSGAPYVEGSWVQEPDNNITLWNGDTSTVIAEDMESGDPLHLTPGTQINPPMIFDSSKTIDFYTVVGDPDGIGSLSDVYGYVYSPSNSPAPYNTPTDPNGNPFFKYKVTYTNLGNGPAAQALVTAANNAGLITFGTVPTTGNDQYATSESWTGSYTLSNLVNSSGTGELQKNVADLYMGQGVLTYSSPMDNIASMFTLKTVLITYLRPLQTPSPTLASPVLKPTSPPSIMAQWP